MSIDYIQESEKYKPDNVKSLLIGEAPPPGGKTYFYIPKLLSLERPIKKDGSLPSTIFNHFFGRRPNSIEEYVLMLTKLKNEGIFLMDILDDPLKIKDKNYKGWVNPDNLKILVSEITNLREKIKNRGIEIEEENITFLLAKNDYRKELRSEFPNSIHIRWNKYRMTVISPPFTIVQVK